MMLGSLSSNIESCRQIKRRVSATCVSDCSVTAGQVDRAGQRAATRVIAQHKVAVQIDVAYTYSTALATKVSKNLNGFTRVRPKVVVSSQQSQESR